MFAEPNQRSVLEQRVADEPACDHGLKVIWPTDHVVLQQRHALCSTVN
jgi:hypothetical protein